MFFRSKLVLDETLLRTSIIPIPTSDVSNRAGATTQRVAPSLPAPQQVESKNITTTLTQTPSKAALKLIDRLKLAKQLQFMGEDDLFDGKLIRDILIANKDNIIELATHNEKYRHLLHRFISDICRNTKILKPTPQLFYLYNLFPEIGTFVLSLLVNKGQFKLALQLVNERHTTISFPHELTVVVNSIEKNIFEEESSISATRLSGAIAQRMQERAAIWNNDLPHTYRILKGYINHFQLSHEQSIVNVAKKLENQKAFSNSHNPLILMWQYLINHLCKQKEISSERKEMITIFMTLLKAIKEKDYDKASRIGLAGIAICRESSQFSTQKRVRLLAMLLKMCNPDSTNLEKISKEFTRRQHEAIYNFEKQFLAFNKFLHENQENNQLLVLFEKSLQGFNLNDPEQKQHQDRPKSFSLDNIRNSAAQQKALGAKLDTAVNSKFKVGS